MKIRKRFIFLFLFLFLAVCLYGCGQEIQRETGHEETPSMFIVVEDTGSWRVLYHRDTKVMYAVSYSYYNSGNFTLLVNPDGTPMLWGG